MLTKAIYWTLLLRATIKIRLRSLRILCVACRCHPAHQGDRQDVQGAQGLLPHRCSAGCGQDPHQCQRPQHRPHVHQWPQDLRTQGGGGHLHQTQTTCQAGGANERWWPGQHLLYNIQVLAASLSGSLNMQRFTLSLSASVARHTVSAVTICSDIQCCSCQTYC